MKELYIQHIASRVGVQPWQVENCIHLFEEGDTIPFISRYRKEKTGGMDDVAVAEVRHWNDVFTEMEKRKETILATIEEQGKLSDTLRECRIVPSGVRGLRSPRKRVWSPWPMPCMR